MRQEPEAYYPFGLQRRPSRANRSRANGGFFTLVAALLLTISAIAGCAGFSAASARATATPRTSATPTVPATTTGILTQRVREALSMAVKQVNVAYSATTGAAVVNVTLVWSPSWRDHFNLAQTQAQTVCYQAQAALWTSHTPLTKVTVIVLGQALDDYADVITSAYAAVDITTQHANSVDWSTITPEKAWTLYDHEFLRPTYTPDWVYPPPQS